MRCAAFFFDLHGKWKLKTVAQIYHAGVPSIAMQSLYTFYVVILNLILKTFTEDAVTVLGIYYKLQTFFLIPLMGLEQVIIPVMSFHYGAKEHKRIRDTVWYANLTAGVLLFSGNAGFPAVSRSICYLYFPPGPAFTRLAFLLYGLSASVFFPLGTVVFMLSYFRGLVGENCTL